MSAANTLRGGRDNRVIVYVTDTELGVLQGAAAAAGEALGVHVRRLALNALGFEPEERSKLTRSP
jgi:hypothetical protein